MKSDTHNKLCKLVTNYKNFTGINCSYRLFTDKDDCTDCDTCSLDEFCNICRTSKIYVDLCKKQNNFADMFAFEQCQPYIYLCPFGLLKIAVPIIQDTLHIGTVTAGCIRMNPKLKTENEKVPHFSFLVPSNEICNRAWHNIPHKTSQEVHYAAQQLFYSVCYTMSTDNSIIQKGHELSSKQSELYEEITHQRNIQVQNLSINASADKKNEPPLGLTKQDEQALIGRIQMGDKTAVKNILNKALGKILLNDASEIDTIKALLIELLISVGRNAIQRNASGDTLFSLYRESIDSLNAADSMSQIYNWTIKTFDKLSALIYESRDKYKYSAVGRITSYVKQHYAEPLTLDFIAEVIGYSPYYISRLFKEELGMTLTDYITEIRISQAKELLENTDDLLSVIAEKVGYQYSHYFSRTFKKRIGISPSEYRRWWRKK